MTLDRSPALLLRRLACVGLCVPALWACDRPVLEANPDTDAVASTDTGAVFDLSPTQKNALSRRALEEDAEASYRLAQYLGMAGGDDGLAGGEDDRLQERRWLELATRQGHPIAEFNLAVELADDDCPRARSIMTRIRDSSPDTTRREEAADWLDEPRFACHR